MKYLFQLFFLLALCLHAAACTKSDSGDDNDGGGGDVGSDSSSRFEIVASNLSAVCAANGVAEFSFDLPEAMDSIQIVSSAPGASLRAYKLFYSEGVELFNAEEFRDEQLTSATDSQASPLSFNYPITPQGAPQPLDPGTYTFSLQSNVVGQEVIATVLGKQDANTASGTVSLNVIFAGVIAQAEESRNSIDSALDTCRGIATEANLSLTIRQIERSDLPSTLPNPQPGHPIYEQISNDHDSGINIIFTANVENLLAPENEIGAAGASPGPLIPSPRSAIVFSINQAAGSDGRFDFEDDIDGVDEGPETRILGETICHELFHYLGLRDSVTFSGSEVVDADVLGSPKCSSLSACEEDKGANGNIMFPFPLEVPEAETRDFFKRDRVSVMQSEVINFSTAVH